MAELEWKNPEDDDTELMVQLRRRPNEWARIRKNLSGHTWNVNLSDLELRKIRADRRFEVEMKQTSMFTCDVYARCIRV